jgi:hypothetical protein
MPATQRTLRGVNVAAAKRALHGFSIAASKWLHVT